jgi:hypothetical protein
MITHGASYKKLALVREILLNESTILSSGGYSNSRALRFYQNTSSSSKTFRSNSSGNKSSI